MTPSDLELSFKSHLEADPRDLATHRAYADWLEEQGRDDEAALHRAWTLDAYDQANEYMLRQIREVIVCDYDKDERWYDEDENGLRDLLDDATKYLATGQRTCLNFDCYDMELNGNMEEFWKHYSVLTGRPVRLDDGESGWFFRCSC